MGMMTSISHKQVGVGVGHIPTPPENGWEIYWKPCEVPTWQGLFI